MKPRQPFPPTLTIHEEMARMERARRYMDAYEAKQRERRNVTTFAAIVIALLIAAYSLASDPADDERATARAFHPSKPSLAQQVAFREDAREQLRLQTIARGGL